MAESDLPYLLLSAATAVVDAVQAGVRDAGFDDVRPAHGFAFLRLSGGGATVVELARHLGVTKQAASQLVEELSRKGYVERTPHPDDGRAVLVVLTERGRACTAAADATLRTQTQHWSHVVGEGRLRTLRDDLARIVPPGPVRPTW
ncbi:DNA-binding MarR family transcriptional regulator [Motilibacter peucedani]|uniref:DNA-binding MarR family transcriptional regulator n=1 Tax=Motilibacter peucedani TaxID=598650 RepID=A0A420XQX9_9ACTN|nr:MarR family transcriptional regulator [Motilibacter peucedani]RKS75634.1 DNA-binding MarR family transcriptional regulator [Motilibacter peucedani]